MLNGASQFVIHTSRMQSVGCFQTFLITRSPRSSIGVDIPSISSASALQPGLICGSSRTFVCLESRYQLVLRTIQRTTNISQNWTKAFNQKTKALYKRKIYVAESFGNWARYDDTTVFFFHVALDMLTFEDIYYSRLALSKSKDGVYNMHVGWVRNKNMLW